MRSPEELDRITDKVKVRYCPMLMDQEQILETEIAVVDGAVRIREDEEKLIEVRRTSRILIAWGTCAVFGGVPALANGFELEELIEGNRQIVCSECPRKFKKAAAATIGVFPDER